ncbi:unnamed protein product [Parnassius apollo]|uniref:(apollo) hypothetical protein n=1 Tax=Parnassius apollo TaxID=110799 RepID=A0A8S3W841_PARAO|nr:unnamed protein product [Parnassius apollo]
MSITGTENKNARTVHANRECTSTDHKRLSTQGQIRPEQNTQELNAQREHKEEQSAEVTTEKNTQVLNKVGQIIKVNTEKQNARAKHTSTKFQCTKKEHRRTECARTDHNRTEYANTECTRTGQKNNRSPNWTRKQ